MTRLFCALLVLLSVTAATAVARPAGAEPLDKSPAQPVAKPADADALPALAPLPRDCQAGGSMATASTPLPNVLKAMRERRRIVVLAIGASPYAPREGAQGGYHELVEHFLERTFKGIDVVIVNRGVSGEIARDAGDRIRTEVGLASPDLVIWQLGTADALARIPTADFVASTAETAQWLKERNVDLVLIGLRYAKALRKDAGYQDIRKAIKALAAERGLLRIGRYEAVETIERLKVAAGAPAGEAELTEASYVCMAESLARAIATGLFAKPKLDKMGPIAPRKQP